MYVVLYIFFFSSRRRHTRLQGDWSSDVCSSDLSRRWASTNTETEASPSVNTRWSTGSAEPGRVWAERAAMRKPGGRRIAFQASVAAAGAGGPDSFRSHWKPAVETSGLKAESGLCAGSVSLTNTIGS